METVSTVVLVQAQVHDGEQYVETYKRFKDALAAVKEEMAEQVDSDEEIEFKVEQLSEDQVKVSADFARTHWLTVITPK